MGSAMRRGASAFGSGLAALVSGEPSPSGDASPVAGAAPADFAHGGERRFASSNVASGSYDPTQNYLELGFKSGSRYGYHDVSPEEASSLDSASSPGGWVWDNLRQRGTVYGYKKPYAVIAGKSSKLPSYYGDRQSREWHRRIAPSGRDIEFSPTTERKLPLAYAASVVGGLRSIFGGQRRAQGGEVEQRFGTGGDDEPIFATPGERVIPKEQAQRDRPLLDAMYGPGSGGQGRHYAGGGVIQSLGATLGGYLGGGTGGALGAAAGSLLGGGDAGGALKKLLGSLVGDAGGDSPAQKPNLNQPLIEAAQQLKDAARHLSDAATQMSGQGPAAGSSLSPDKWITNQQGIPQLFGPGNMPPVATPAAPPGGAAAGAGAAGLIIAAAIAVNAGFDALAEGLGGASDKAVAFATGMAQAGGVPKSVADLGGSILNLVSPLKAAEVGINAMQFAISPILNLDKPGKIVTEVWTGVAQVGQSLVRVFLDLRDPAAMLSQAVAPFVNQVNKFNPGIVERMNLSFDHLTAAAGRWFQPVIEAAEQFANVLNQIYTAMVPDITPLIAGIVDPVKQMAEEFVGGFFGMIRANMPVFQGMVEDFRRLQPAVSGLGSAVIKVAEFAIQAAGTFASGFASVVETIYPYIREGLSVLSPLWGIAREGWRTLTVLWDVAKTVGEELVRIGDGIGTLDFVVWSLITSLQTLAAAVSATASHLRRTVDTMINPVANPGQTLQMTMGGGAGLFINDFRAALERIRSLSPSQGAPTPGGMGMTYSAQPARHVGIEEVGLEARRQAFSQGTSVAERTAQSAEQIAQNTAQQLEILRQLVAQGALSINQVPPGVML